eukprot:12402851-Karenia_brevis.AAC.1
MECRNGTLSRDGCFFMHGVPTETVGSLVLGEEAPRCERARCRELQSEVLPRMVREGATWADMTALECD